MPCVRPFHAPCTPPVPPSTEFNGSPTRMLMFWSALVPYRMLTWQYATFAPAAGTIWLFADLTPGVASRARPVAVSAAQPRGAAAEGCGGFEAAIIGQIRAEPKTLTTAMRSGAECMDVL